MKTVTYNETHRAEMAWGTFVGTDPPLGSGEYGLTIAPGSNGMPAAVAVVSMVTADLTVTWKGEAFPEG